MRQNVNTRLQKLSHGSLVTIAMLLVTALPGIEGLAPRAAAGANSPRWVLAPGDTVAADQLIRPENLARMLADSTARQPAVLHVGFKFLYQSAHIPQSRYIGPASKPEGRAALRKALEEIPRRQGVVLYCGCCPWSDCPNLRPAFRIAREMGFKDVRVLYVVKDLKSDWIDKGLPVSKGDN